MVSNAAADGVARESRLKLTLDAWSVRIPADGRAYVEMNYPSAKVGSQEASDLSRSIAPMYCLAGKGKGQRGRCLAALDGSGARSR